MGLSAAAPVRPLPQHAPEQLAPRSLQVHVRAHEDLAPDALRALARPRVTLWLETRSNTLKASTLEHLKRFDSAYVRLSGPLSVTQARALDTVPTVGVWLKLPALDGPGMARVLGPRPLAVQVEGRLDEAAFERLRRARPKVMEWAAPAQPELMEYAWFRQLSGRRLITLAPSGLAPRACEGQGDGPAARVHLASLLALGTAAFPCGKAPMVVLGTDTDRWLIQALLTRDPTAELELQAPDDGAAAKVAGLLEELGLGPSR